MDQDVGRLLWTTLGLWLKDAGAKDVLLRSYPAADGDMRAV